MSEKVTTREAIASKIMVDCDIVNIRLKGTQRNDLWIYFRMKILSVLQQSN